MAGTTGGPNESRNRRHRCRGGGVVQVCVAPRSRCNGLALRQMRNAWVGESRDPAGHRDGDAVVGRPRTCGVSTGQEWYMGSQFCDHKRKRNYVATSDEQTRQYGNPTPPSPFDFAIFRHAVPRRLGEDRTRPNRRYRRQRWCFPNRLDSPRCAWLFRLRGEHRRAQHQISHRYPGGSRQRSPIGGPQLPKLAPYPRTWRGLRALRKSPLGRSRTGGVYAGLKPNGCTCLIGELTVTGTEIGWDSVVIERRRGRPKPSSRHTQT